MASLDNKTVLAIQVIGALVIGILAWWLSKHWLEEEEANLRSTFFSNTENRISVVVATDNLDPGTVLTDQVLAAAEVDLTFLPEDVIPAAEFSSIDGARLRRPLVAGKPLLYSYLEPSISDRFSDLVGPGQRAVTLQVDSLSSIEGMMEVGDRIDLLLREKQNDNMELIVLAEAVPVIATGAIRRASMDNPQAVAGTSQVEAYYNSLTVVLDTDTAARALIARESQSLVYLLRGKGDTRPLTFQRIEAHTMPDGLTIPFFSGNRHEGGQLSPRVLRRPQS